MQQYYVAVGCAQSKLVTLQDLLAAVTSETSSSIRVGVCCSSRDTCDEVVFALNRVRAERQRMCTSVKLACASNCACQPRIHALAC